MNPKRQMTQEKMQLPGTKNGMFQMGPGESGGPVLEFGSSEEQLRGPTASGRHVGSTCSFTLCLS